MHMGKQSLQYRVAMALFSLSLVSPRPLLCFRFPVASHSLYCPGPLALWLLRNSSGPSQMSPSSPMGFHLWMPRSLDGKHGRHTSALYLVDVRADTSPPCVSPVSLLITIVPCSDPQFCCAPGKHCVRFYIIGAKTVLTLSII